MASVGRAVSPDDCGWPRSRSFCCRFPGSQEQPLEQCLQVVTPKQEQNTSQLFLVAFEARLEKALPREEKIHILSFASGAPTTAALVRSLMFWKLRLPLPRCPPVLFPLRAAAGPAPQAPQAPPLHGRTCSSRKAFPDHEVCLATKLYWAPLLRPLPGRLSLRFPH